jgi:DME family drug/metabolite transporter
VTPAGAASASFGRRLIDFHLYTVKIDHTRRSCAAAGPSAALPSRGWSAPWPLDSVVELWNNRRMRLLRAGRGGDGAGGARHARARASELARAQVLLAALCFGTTGTAQALGPDGTDPVGVGAARILVGGVLLAAVAVARRRATRERWARTPVAAAVAGVAVYQLAFFAAVADTGVAVGTIVALGSAPTLAGLFEWLVDRRRPSGRWAAATALACAGVALLALAGGDADVSPTGIALAVTAGGSYAVYTLAAKRLLQAGHSPESVMAAAFGLGALVLLPVLLATTPVWLVHADGIALALFLGVVPTAVAYLLFANGLKHLSASETATLTLAEPLTAGVLGALVLAESLPPTALAGAGLVLGGLVALTIRPPLVAAPAPA